MSWVNSRGDVLGGQGGYGPNILLMGQTQAVTITPGSNVAGFLDDDTALFNSPAAQASAIGLDGSGARTISGAQLSSGCGLNAEWMIFSGAAAGVTMNIPGGPLPAARNFVAALDGTLVAISSYSEGLGLDFYTRSGGLVRSLPAARPLYAQGFWVDATHGIYLDIGAGRWVGDGVPDPVFVPGTNLQCDAWIAEIDGTYYVGYHPDSSPDQYVVHPLTDPSAGWVLATGYINGTYGRVIGGTTIACGYGTNAGEAGPTGLGRVLLDVTSAKVPLVALGSSEPTPPVAESVNAPIAVVPELPGFTHPIDICLFSPRTPDISTIPLAQLGAFTESLTDAVWTVPDESLPLLDCDDGNAGDIFPPIPTAPNGDRVEAAPELYLSADTSAAGKVASIADWRTKIADLLSRPGVTAITPVVMLYCQSASPSAAEPSAAVNEKWTEQTILDLWPVYVEIANSDPRIVALLIFADVRANGVSGHPVFEQLLRQVITNAIAAGSPRASTSVPPLSAPFPLADGADAGAQAVLTQIDAERIQ